MRIFINTMNSMVKMVTNQKLLKQIFQRCLKENLFITSIESCTGGLISGAITDIPGSSKIFEQGLITYSNKSKIELLGVSEETIQNHGAVSREVIIEMAVNPVVTQTRKNQITIATSGVAGPDQSENKPVGLIWLASYRKDNLIVKKITLGNLDRTEIRRRTVSEALKLLNKNLKS